MKDEQMRRATDKTTEGPWEVIEISDNPLVVVSDPIADYKRVVCSVPLTDPTVSLGVQPELDLEFVAAARQWVPDALDRLQEVRALHAPDTATDTAQPFTYCTECGATWPCPTIKAIDGK